MIELIRFYDPRPARQLGAFLENQGIATELRESDGQASLYLVNDSDLETAVRWRDEFVRAPHHPRFRPDSPWQTGEPLAPGEGDDRTPIFTGEWLRSMGPVTRTLLFASVIIFMLQFAGVNVYSWLMFPDSLESLASQPWRLFTPMLMHLNLLHIIFNMIWWVELGRVIERFQSSWQLTWITLVTGALSAVAQFLSTGPAFGGLSGVVYGLLGYLWIYGRINPAAGYALRKEVVILMLGWLVFCYVGLADIVANEAHLAGLLTGCVLGTAVGLWRRGRY